MSIAQRRILLWGTLGALVAAGLVYAFWPQPVPVDLGVVKRGPLEVTIEEEGETRVQEAYVVSAPLSGQLMRVETEVGDRVTAGETIVAKIRPVQPTLLDVRSQREAEAVVKAAEAAQALAEAELERARAKLAFAESDLARAARLAERGNISERARDVAALEVRTAKAAVVSAEAALQVKAFELETARAALISPLERPADPAEYCCVEVRAPVDGRVLRRVRESEIVVAAGDPILEIGNPEELEIVVDLLSEEAVKVEPGNPVRIEGWGGQSLPGRVQRIEPYGFTKISALGIEEQRVNVIIDFVEEADRRPRLGHGYRVDVAIIVWQDDDVLQLPASALFRRGDEWAVFVEQDGRAALRTIELGKRNDFAAEVIKGLAAGNRLIVHPSDRVVDSVRIEQRANDAP